jgi:hypothetical protein
MDADDLKPNPCELLVAGTIKGAANSDVGLTVAIETVVPDNELPEILTLYAGRTRTDADGRYVDRYAVPDADRRKLHGWVMCTVVVQPQRSGCGGYTKAVRWQRQTSAELIAGLNALLASVSFDVGVATPAEHRSTGGRDHQRRA